MPIRMTFYDHLCWVSARDQPEGSFIRDVEHAFLPSFSRKPIWTFWTSCQTRQLMLVPMELISDNTDLSDAGSDAGIAGSLEHHRRLNHQATDAAGRRLSAICIASYCTRVHHSASFPFFCVLFLGPLVIMQFVCLPLWRFEVWKRAFWEWRCKQSLPFKFFFFRAPMCSWWCCKAQIAWCLFAVPVPKGLFVPRWEASRRWRSSLSQRHTQYAP